MATHKIKFFTTFDESPFTFKDEGVPYGPKWTLAKTKKRLSEPVYEDSIYGPSRTANPFELISQIKGWASIVSPHRDKLIGLQNPRTIYLDFHCYIGLEQDKKEQEIAKKTCANCRATISENLYVRFPDSTMYLCNSCYDYNPRKTNFEKFLKFEKISDVKILSCTSLLKHKIEPSCVDSTIDLFHLHDNPYLSIFAPTTESYEDMINIIEDPFLHAVIVGDIFTVRQTVENYASKLNTLDSNGNAPLHYAANLGHTSIIRTLVHAGAQIDLLDSRKSSPLILALIGSHSLAVKALLDLGADPNENCNGNLFGMSVSSPLYHAIDSESGELALAILSAGANPNGIGGSLSKQLTPLHFVVKREWYAQETIAFLIEYGADVNAPDETGLTPLHFAAQDNCVGNMEMLVESGKCNIDATDDNGETPLFLACKNGSERAVVYLIKKGANSDIRNKQMLSPADIAHNKENFGCVIYAGALLDKGTAIFEAARTGHINSTSELMYLIKVSQDLVDENGMTPLHLAALNGHKDVLLLFSKNENIDLCAEDPNGMTPLHLAAGQGHADVVEALSSLYSSVDPRPRGTDLKSFRRARGNADDNEDLDIYSWITPLYLAAQNGHEEVVKILLKRGAKVTPAVCAVAAQEGHAKIVDLFWHEKGFRDSMLYWGCLNGHQDVAQVFGSLVFTSIGDHMTPLHYAVYGGNREIVKDLLYNEVDVNEAMEDGTTALHCAAQQGYEDIALILIENGARVNEKDSNGNSPLHIAAELGHSNVVKLLEQKGAIKDK